MNFVVDKAVYLEALDELSTSIESVPNTHMGMWIKVLSLVTLNMRYERVALDPNLSEHPYAIVRRLVQDELVAFRGLADIRFIESSTAPNIAPGGPPSKEEKHRTLFDLIWNRYDAEAFENYVERYRHRLRINGLAELVDGKRCLDMGCGNGNFCFAMADFGAAHVAGIDFGAESIAHAERMRASRPNGERCEFAVRTVYDTGFPSDCFDFVVQNGVFHHLDDEPAAIRELARVLKRGGHAWYYTDGEGGIAYDLWDRSVHLLREVPAETILEVLDHMNVSLAKRTHLADGLKATYRHTNWDAITEMLSHAGFGNFRRLVGGFPTDCDHDVIAADPYGNEKFGEGDLRILAQLVDKPGKTSE